MDERVILLVEDNPDDVALTMRALQKNHILNPLVVVHDGQEAADFLFGGLPAGGHHGWPAPALVLLDLNLPKIPGLELLQRLRADPRTRFVPVVVLTSSKEDQDLLASYRLGANSYVRKPVDFSQFNEAVRTLSLYWLLLNEPPPPQDVAVGLN